MINHPLPAGTNVVYKAAACNCAPTNSRTVKRAKIVRVMDFNGTTWYALDNGKQVHNNKILSVEEQE